MTPKTDPDFAVGDIVEVPWELEERKGIVRALDRQLNRATVELIIEGHPERFNFPASAVSPAYGDAEDLPDAGEPWAGGVDDNTMLKAVLNAVGADRRVSVHLAPTTDENGDPLLFLDVILLDPEDDNLAPEQLLDLQTQVRDRVFEALRERSIVIAQVLPRETSAA